MQTDLVAYNFEDPSPQEVYHDLVRIGYPDGCKQQILSTLWDLKSHSLEQVKAAGGSQYNARILELRREGWNIINERSLNPVRSYYRLISRNRR